MRMEPIRTDSETAAERERRFAAAAVELARESPANARVGALIVIGPDVVATGFKGERDDQHAEQVAIRKAVEANVDLRRAELYTTLEPCANLGTSRTPCSELIVQAGIRTVHIGLYDRNPRVYRLGWKYLRDNGVKLRDFPPELREASAVANANFDAFFTAGDGMSSGAKFDFTQNGGQFDISVDTTPSSPTWTTRWSSRGADSIYLNGGVPGVIAHARYAGSFDEIDDPGALDYASHVVAISVGDIGVVRSAEGYVLCKVTSLEPTGDHGGGDHTSVTIKWEIRLEALGHRGH